MASQEAKDESSCDSEAKIDGLKADSFEKSDGLPSPSLKGCGCYVAANDQFFSYAAKYSKYALVIKNFGKNDEEQYQLQSKSEIKYIGWKNALNISSAQILDLTFNPFVKNIITLGYSDGTIKSIQFVYDNNNSNDVKNNGNIQLIGEIREDKDIKKKINECIVNYHPSSQSILASVGKNSVVKIFDIEKNKSFLTYSNNNTIATGNKNNYKIEFCKPKSMKWNENGSLIALASDKNVIEIFDPRISNINNNKNSGGIVIIPTPLPFDIKLSNNKDLFLFLFLTCARIIPSRPVTQEGN